MKIAVLGAGVTGLSVSRMLKDKGYDVTLYEKNDRVGGLARSRFVDGILYDPHGGHIFNSKDKRIVDWVFSILPKDKWKYTERNAKIYFEGNYISYPFELSLCELDIEYAVNCIYDYITAQQGPEPDNFKDWIIWNFGKSIADYYMIPYNEKIWAYPLDEMETKWMDGKMPMPSKKEMIKSMLLKNPSERKMPHSTFFYPLNGGIQSLMNEIVKGVNCVLDYEILSINKMEDKWCINNEELYDRIISTIPLPELGRIMDNIPSNVNNSINDLKFNSLTTVLFECPKTDITWLYIPSHKYRSHRVGYQSTLTPNASKNNTGCAALEIIGDRFDLADIDKRNDVLPEELGFTKALDSEFTKYAYVIHDINYRRNIDNIFKYYDCLDNFDLLGRWGKWNYNNMDICIKDAMNYVDMM